jgi:hypothetical protein
MSYNGSGTFQINTSGQPVVAGTVISATAFNALTADLATGLSTAITKDGQTTTTARIPFAAGINSTLTTDSSSVSTGSIITAGGIGAAKAAYIGTTLNVGGASTFTGAIAVDSVTDSSSTTTGSIQTDGGVGIAKALFVGTTANIAGVTTVQAGTALLPAITTTGDTNTGIFFPAADTIAFSEGGVESMRIDSSGNVGIGTSSPSNHLDVIGSGAQTIRVGSTNGDVANLSMFSNGNATWSLSSDTVMRFKKDSTEYMRIDTSGNVGIGTTATTYNYQTKNIALYDATSAGISIASGSKVLTLTSQSSGGIFVGSRSNDNLIFVTNDTERARIDTSGNLLVGTTSTDSAAKMRVAYGASANGIAIQDTNNTSGTSFVIFQNSTPSNIGSIARVTTTNAVIYNTTSDYRLKTVTGFVTGQGSRIDALKPVDYLWKDGGQQARGFLAHEFQTVYPNSVSGTKDDLDADGNPVYQAMQAATSEVIADLVAEIQSLRKRLATLEQA